MQQETVEKTPRRLYIARFSRRGALPWYRTDRSDFWNKGYITVFHPGGFTVDTNKDRSTRVDTAYDGVARWL